MPEVPGAGAILAEVEKALRVGMVPGFEQKVAANAVALAVREARLAPKAEAAELQRLHALLAVSGDLESLNRNLCLAIRARRMSADDPGLVDHLRRLATEKMAIDQPSYPAFRTAEQTSKASE